MGVDYFNCCNCGEISNDCCDFTGCDACDERVCVYCMDECRRGSHTYVCEKCWEDQITENDKHWIAVFLLKPHQEEYKALEDVRRILRDKNSLFKPCVKIDAYEKDVKQLIEKITAQGLDYDASDHVDDTESEDDEPHMVDGMVVIPETTKKHERPGEIIIDDDEPGPKVAKSE